MWREMPVVYTRFTDSEGNCIGFDWNCDNKWSARNPGKLHEFLLFRDAHDIIWEWISLNPCNKVTAQNFLNATW